MKNACIEINGYRMLCTKLMDALYHGGRWLPEGISFEARCDYDQKRSIIEDYINDYRQGSTEVSGDLRSHYKNDNLPENIQYPEAIAEMLLKVEKATGINLPALLESAEKASIKETDSQEEEEKRRQSLHAIVNKLMSGASLPLNAPDKIRAIVTLQIEKKKEPAYRLTKDEWEKENSSAELWCDMLTHSCLGDKLPYYLMKSLVEHDIISEFDITEILNRLGDKRDFEWYDEGFMGSDLMDETILSNASIMPLVEPVFEKNLNLR